MKNAEQKKEFLMTLPVENQVMLERVFHAAEPLEKKLNKDCSLFTMEEIDILFGHERLKSPRGVAMKCDLLAKYTIWMQQNYPLKYATYTTYAEKYNLYFPMYTEERINPMRVYTPNEFMDTVDEMESMYDQMLFLGVYEGLWTSTHVMDFFLLREQDLDINTNIATLDSGREIPVSDTLMDLLLEGSAQRKNKGRGIQNLTFECVMYRDPTICYKRLNVDPNADPEDTKMRIKNHMQNERRLVQKQISNPDKFTLLNISMSGMLNALIEIGVTERFNDHKMYEENSEAGAIADRYDFVFRNTQKNNFNRRFEPYFTSAE